MRLRQVLPVLALHYKHDILTGHAVTFRKNPWRLSRIILLAYLYDLFFIQFRRRVLFSDSTKLIGRLRSVLGVCGSRASIEVRRVTASTIIAAVANNCAVWNRANKVLVGNTMRKSSRAVRMMQCAISCFASPLPFPALVWFTNTQSAEKSLHNRCISAPVFMSRNESKWLSLDVPPTRVSSGCDASPLPTSTMTESVRNTFVHGYVPPRRNYTTTLYMGQDATIGGRT